jgi:AraC-like DNA-binding protein
MLHIQLKEIVMKHVSIKTDYIDKYCSVKQIPLFSGKLPDLYIPAVSEFKGTGNFSRTYSLPYEAVHIVTAGDWSVKLDDDQYYLKKGYMIFLLRYQQIHTEDNPGNHVTHYWFDLKGTQVADILKQAGIRKGNQCFKGNFDTILGPMLKQLTEAYTNDSYDPLLSVSSAWRFMETVSKFCAKQEEIISNNVADAAALIFDREFMGKISVDEIAERLNINRTTLFRHFKKKYRISPKQYIDNLRVDYAKTLLGSTSLNVSEIYHRSGYENLQNFFHMFKKITGTTPKQWRINQSKSQKF